MTKSTGTGISDWAIFDSTRSPSNPVDVIIDANSPNAQRDGSDDVDFLSNGFKLRSQLTATNNSGNTYLYVAFAENPFGGSNVSPANAR